jgi:phage pre-neck appendage-like protein
MIRKKKISQLPLSESFIGLYTIGVDAANRSVKVSLQWLKESYDSIIEAIGNANKAANNAKLATSDVRKLETTVSEREEKRVETEKIRQEYEQKRIENESDRVVKEEKREERINLAISNMGKATDSTLKNVEEKIDSFIYEIQDQAGEALESVDNATTRLNSLSDHRDKIVDGYWYRWNETTGEYENTHEPANSVISVASFDIDPATGYLNMFSDDDYSGPGFAVDKDGILTVTV